MTEGIEDINIKAYNRDLERGTLDNYKGNWIAYYNGDFLGFDETIDGLIGKVSNKTGDGKLFIHQADGNPIVKDTIDYILEMDQA